MSYGKSGGILSGIGTDRARRAQAMSVVRRLPRSSSLGRIVAALAAAIAASLVAPIAASAQTNPAPAFSASGVVGDDPVLARLIDESLAARPEIAQAQATVRAQRERVPQAGALPDPVLQLGIQNDGFRSIQVGQMETSFYSISASQTFPWPGKRRLRGEVAEFDAQAAGEGVNRLRLTTVADVRRGYLELLLTRARLGLLDTLEGIWTQSVGAARARYESGGGAQSDVLRSQLELNRIKQRRWGLLAQERAQLEALNRLRGHALDEPIASGSQLRDAEVRAPGDEAIALRTALEQSPEIGAARAALQQAARSIDLAHKSYYPDLSVSAGVMPRGGQFEPMWQLGVGGTLPVFAGSKQNRAVDEAEARELSGRKNIEALEQVLRLRLAQRAAALRALADTVRLYREGLLVQSQATAASTLSQYEVGKASFASVLEANAGYVNDQDGLLQALADARRIAIAEAEVSLEPPPFAGAGGGMAGAGVPGAGAGMASSGGSAPSGSGAEPTGSSAASSAAPAGASGATNGM